MALVIQSDEQLEKHILDRIGSPKELGLFLLDDGTRAYVSDALNEFLDTQQESSRIKPNNIGEDFAVVSRTSKYLFSIHIHRSLKSLIHSPSTVAASALFCSLPITISEYRISKPVEYEIFQSDASLVPEPQRLHDGEPLISDPHAYRIWECSAASPVVELRIGLRPGVSQIWHFDRVTLQAKFASIANVQVTGYVMLSRMLSSLQERRALELLRQLSRHDAHVVRWAAVQAIGRLDRNLALDCLAESLKDPHPHIRSSAQKALAKASARL